jgi:acyl-CoA thioesterase-1
MPSRPFPPARRRFPYDTCMGYFRRRRCVLASIAVVPSLSLLVSASLCAGAMAAGQTKSGRADSRRSPAAARAARGPVVIVAFGDSLTAGLGTSPGHSYPAYLQRDLTRAGYRARVINAGESGDTTTDGLERLSAVLALKPDIVILEFGGNDGLRGLPVATTRANLQTMIAALRRARVAVLLAGMSLPPNYGAEYIRSFQQVYREMAREDRVALIPFLLADVVVEARRHPDRFHLLFQPDGIHPTDRGSSIVAQTVLRYLKPLLKRRER